MATLYLTRHGQTVWNIEKIMQGWLDSPLTETGIRHAELLAKRLQEVELAAVYSSPSLRAYRTAEIIKGTRNLEIISDDNLREMNMGSWEGRSILDLERECPEQHHAYWKTPGLYVPDSGESFGDTHKRAIAAVTRIAAKHENENVLIVSHAVTLKLILAYFEKRPLENLWDLPFIHGTSLSIVECSESSSRILLHGDISHIPEE